MHGPLGGSGEPGASPQEMISSRVQTSVQVYRLLYSLRVLFYTEYSVCIAEWYFSF